jgi:sugar lactone lactonase YvrE
MTNTSNLFIKLFLLLLLPLAFGSCALDTNELSNRKNTWNISDGVEFPNNRPLSRSEDGVMLPDGTLIVADQRYGLAKIDITGSVEPFGNFNAIGYMHNPPAIESGPNGVHLSPQKTHILTADIFNGKIYRTSIDTGTTEIIYSHEYGVNTAIQDSSGAIWFTQSTLNKNEERMFGAIAKPIPDGALFRLPLLNGREISKKPELIIDELNFANGFYIDEPNKKFYVSETMANRVLSFDLDISEGILSNKSVLAEIPSPDNMRLNHDYSLWVASPLSNRIFSVDTDNGDYFVVFDAQTEKGAINVKEGLKRVREGDGIADLIGPELIGNMPGLLTGMIIGSENQPFYVANLGAALIKVSTQ